MSSNLLVTNMRVFTAKAMWKLWQPTVIGTIEDVVRHILASEDFKNGIEYIKELDGLKFKRVSKKDIQLLLSNTPEQIDLFNRLKY